MPASLEHQERMLRHLEGQGLLVRVKVRAGFYRCGSLCIHKGHRWCVYHEDKFLERFRTLEAAHWWSSQNQPTPAKTEAQDNAGVTQEVG